MKASHQYIKKTDAQSLTKTQIKTQIKKVP